MKTTRRNVLGGALGIAASALYRVSGTPGAQLLKGDIGTVLDPAPARLQAETVAWPKLLAHWKMDGDCQDATGRHHGESLGTSFVEGIDGRPNSAARFDGLDHFVEVADHEDFHFGTQEFSISLWISLAADLDSVVGDILSKFDSIRRRGLNLSVGGSSPGYNSIGDAKYLHFGIDNGILGSWHDCGKPWKSNPLVGTLTVYKGQLYTGIADASKPEDACRVFRYEGGMDWIDCGRLGNNPLTLSVMSMIVHKGHLYAGTGVYDWDKARAGIGGSNHVYRYDGGTKWRDCGQLGNGFRTMSLASFKGNLFASDDSGCCYRYDGDQKWIFCGQLVDKMFNTMIVYKGHLYGASHPAIYRYEGGSSWTCIGRNPFGATQIHKLQVYDGHLHAGTWPLGKVLRYLGGTEWKDCGQLGIATDKFQINEVNDLTVYNGKLYAGVIPRAEVYRYEQNSNWTLLRSLVTHPSWSPGDVHTWFRVPCLTVFQGKLFQGTSTCHGRADPLIPAEAGRVYAMEAGRSVSYDHDVGSEWRHVVAVRDKNVLRFYVDGHLNSSSTTFTDADYDISNRSQLLIGFGSNGSLSGTLDDIRLYRGVLDANQVRDLYKRRGQ